MINQSIITLVLVAPVIVLVFLLVKTYKSLPNKEEKNKITFPLLIGLIISILCVLVGLRTPTVEFGKFMSGQNFKCGCGR